MVSVLVVGVATVAVSSFAFLALARGLFNPIILGILAAQESERALLFHELYARGLSCEDIAEVGRRIYTVTTTANSR